MHVKETAMHINDFSMADENDVRLLIEVARDLFANPFSNRN